MKQEDKTIQCRDKSGELWPIIRDHQKQHEKTTGKSISVSEVVRKAILMLRNTSFLIGLASLTACNESQPPGFGILLLGFVIGFAAILLAMFNSEP